MTEFAIIGICVMVTALLTTALVLGVLAYGMKCGKAMQGDIPKLVEKPEGCVEEVPMGNPYD